ncbi:hypothetical protein [Streptomyces sp. NPDC101455]|uniref:hypothetical protein n=1 Tax=Streptomyces sp. NPDC101455 TaxID=3366142 RepID=UPI0037FF5682
MTQPPDVLDDVPELKQAVDAVCKAAPSESRRKQIRAHARELVRALRHPAHPLAVGDDLADVFKEASLKAYEDLALEGQLRSRGRARPTAEGTANVRSGVMVLLQLELGLEVVRLSSLRDLRRTTAVVGPNTDHVVRSSPQALAHYIGHKIDRSAARGLLAGGYPRWVRMMALILLVLDTGARVGELCALRLEDLSPALDEVRITRRPQSRRLDISGAVEVYRLRWATREALQRWLLVRRLLLAEHIFATDALWISVQDLGGQFEVDQDGSALKPDTVSRSYTRIAAKINAQRAGGDGWEPLPDRMEQLRRGVAEPVQFMVPQTPDCEQAARLLGRLEAAGQQLAALSGAACLTATDRGAYDEACLVLREAWRIRVQHHAQLAALSKSGLTTLEVPDAGWNPELLRALDRAMHLAA